MYYAQVGDDKKSFNGRVRGYISPGQFVDCKFELRYSVAHWFILLIWNRHSEEKTKALLPEAKSAEEETISDPLFQWFLEYRIYEILEYLLIMRNFCKLILMNSTYIDPSNLSEEEKAELKKEIIEIASSRKLYVDRLEDTLGADPKAKAGKKAAPKFK